MLEETRVLILPPHPIVNQDALPCFEFMDAAYSSRFYTALYMNLYENARQSVHPDMIIPFLDERDADYLSSLVTEAGDAPRFRFASPDYFSESVDAVLKQEEKPSSRVIALRSDGMGFLPETFTGIDSVLQIENDVLTLCVTGEHIITCAGWNTWNDSIVEALLRSNESIEQFLRAVADADAFVTTLPGHHCIRNKADFSRLYHLLSTKESMAYCSKFIHDQFTELFIEFKEHI